MPHFLPVSSLIPIDVLFNIILNLKQIFKKSFYYMPVLFRCNCLEKNVAV